MFTKAAPPETVAVIGTTGGDVSLCEVAKGPAVFGLGGEMISLPAVEAVLHAHYASDTDEGPVLAVEATPDEQHPELILFTTRQIDRESANRCIRDAGLSGLHNIRRIINLNEIPLLGTGKTDYRALKANLSDTS